TDLVVDGLVRGGARQRSSRAVDGVQNVGGLVMSQLTPPTMSHRARSRILAKMLYLIGIGLSDPEDVTVRGLELIRSSARVFLDAYTSILSVGQWSWQTRDLVEQGDVILAAAQSADVSFLVVGDPLGATTHADLAMRARQRGVAYRVVHNASVLTAVASCGLQLYTFGETVSSAGLAASWTNCWGNWERNLHTLCLLDIRVREPTMESLLRGRPEFEPPSDPVTHLTPPARSKLSLLHVLADFPRRRFMSCSVAAEQLLALLAEASAAEDNADLLADSDAAELRNRLNRRKQLSPPERLLTVGLARLGSPDERIAACSLADIASRDLGPPLHSLVVPAPRLHPVEAEFLRQFADTEADAALVDASAAE
uniref:diphthine methyl ester synthase n=1 Tax=Macrostomum lignano TaxID=282301 RepID=A0A1I8JNC1_9PLAT